MHGEITETEYGALLKADAERPIDLEMLTAFHDGYRSKLSHYSGILQGAAQASYSSGNRDSWIDQERDIDAHVDALDGKLPLWRENLQTVFEFLEELRITSGRGLVTAGQFEGTSAHWLVQLVLTMTIASWRACTGVAQRSQTDDRYRYAATATSLFCENCLALLPTPQSLGERLREEFVLARTALANRPADAHCSTSTIGSTASDVDELAMIDNQSRELILFGEVAAIVGRAGQLFRPTSMFDCGIDAEIEFKDHAGNASGQRVYLQLKSGDSHLYDRKADDTEVFSIKNPRHVEYWQAQAYPVMLVIRKSNGLIRWMNVSAWLQEQTNRQAAPVKQICFQGEEFTSAAVRSFRDALIPLSQ
ncbi:MAG: DUF4365 domain-containing protein [Pirellulales bacterium]